MIETALIVLISVALGAWLQYRASSRRSPIPFVNDHPGGIETPENEDAPVRRSKF